MLVDGYNFIHDPKIQSVGRRRQRLPLSTRVNLRSDRGSKHSLRGGKSPGHHVGKVIFGPKLTFWCWSFQEFGENEQQFGSKMGDLVEELLNSGSQGDCEKSSAATCAKESKNSSSLDNDGVGNWRRYKRYGLIDSRIPLYILNCWNFSFFDPSISYSLRINKTVWEQMIPPQTDLSLLNSSWNI